MKKRLRRPSPAMVVAIVALIAALGGTALAGGFITKKKAKTVADKQITKRAPGLSVASAATAKNVFFAKVSYSTASPVVVSGTPGIAGDGEQFAGAPRLTFPRNMESCAVTAILDNSGTDGIARRSDLSEGARVVLVLRDQASALIRSGYNVVAICP